MAVGTWPTHCPARHIVITVSRAGQKTLLTAFRGSPIPLEASLPAGSTLPGRHEHLCDRHGHAKSGNAAPVYSTYFGQINQQVGLAIGVGPGGMVAIVGRTGNNGVQGTDNAARNSYAGGLSDGFVSIFK